MNQTRPHCVNQMGKTNSKPLVARHGRVTAWARHGNGMLCVNRPLLSPCESNYIFFGHKKCIEKALCGNCNTRAISDTHLAVVEHEFFFFLASLMVLVKIGSKKPKLLLYGKT